MQLFLSTNLSEFLTQRSFIAQHKGGWYWFGGIASLSISNKRSHCAKKVFCFLTWSNYCSSDLQMPGHIVICTFHWCLFQFIPLDSFEGQSITGQLVPVIPGGRTIQLNFNNRKEYVDAVFNYRLKEMNQQVFNFFSENMILFVNNILMEMCKLRFLCKL